ncbi:transient receptor potential cation channel subfamily M member 2-like [Crassostrea angulata]|uniref:transient receptor potential cation channel subfamily M member 2-like n=1 Tax=Magallana angulata TaxID=2784310 RepID=UPI0022B126D3|nr:transient receptor potential cation channel subfamily M member 2-like [Crassostrea angulata]
MSMTKPQSSGMQDSQVDASDVDFTWNEITQGVTTTNSTSDDGNTSPTMVFSVIGDSDSFVPRPWPKTVFQTALIEAAKSGGETWILYLGKKQGISKVVRDAYRNYEDIEFKTRAAKNKINNPDRHVKLINLAGKKACQGNSEKITEFKTTHGEGHGCLLDFEKFVSQQEVSFFSQKMDTKMPVPIAIIVCEGDIETIAHIAKALQHKLPVIIMKGSGMAADLVVDYLENKNVLCKKASISLGIRFDDSKYKELKKHLKTIGKAKELVGVFDLDQDDPAMLSHIVGEAVVSCWSLQDILHTYTDDGVGIQKHEEISLSSDHSHTETNGNTTKGSSLAWKLLRRNFVSPEEQIIHQVLEGFKESRPYVLNPQYSSPTSLPLYFYFGYQLLQELDLTEECGPVLLLEALKANRCDYVRVLLDQGVKLKMINLPELYEQTVSCQKCKFKRKDCLHMQWILKQIQETQAKKLCHEYRSMMRKRIKHGNPQEAKYIVDELTELSVSVADAARGLCRKMLRYKEYSNEYITSETSQTSDGNLKDTNMSDILLWAIFANRKELAEICWLRGENHLLTGLVCSAILRKLSKKANNVKEQLLSIDLEKHSKLFEQRCIGIMDSMYEEDSQHAIDLMDDEAVVWGIHSSPLTFAYENFMYDVVAHTCSQKYMNMQWYKNLAPDLTPFLLSAIRKPKNFFTAPLTKYMFNYILFFAVLIMYSSFVLTSIGDKYYSQLILARVFEYTVYFWGAGDFIEEIISCFGCLEKRGRSHRGYYSRMKRYIYDFWNVVDLLSYLLLIVALFIRHFHPSETFTLARRMYALSLLVMYLRFLEVFLIHRKLGPTLIMIKEMLKDLLRFLYIAVFVVFGVGIYYHANLWPDHQAMWSGGWTNWRIWTIIYYPYWQLYGDLNLEELNGSNQTDCTSNPKEWETDFSKTRCPQEDWTVYAIVAIYMLFSNILLVNLVIAMFSYTFERVQENSEKLWRFERYTVINDYDWRIPSPINLVFLPYRLFRYLAKHDCCLPQCKKICIVEKKKKEKKKREKNEAYQRSLQRIIALRNHSKL